MDDKRIESGIACLLDGLVYDRIEIDGSVKPPELMKDGNWLRQFKENLFRADKDLIDHRLAFINRMYRGGPITKGTFFPQPYRELAATLRDMGRGYAARRVLGHMEWRSLKGSPDSIVGWFFSALYGFTFGFGYSSLRAAGTVLVVWLVATIGFQFAENCETLGQLLPERPVMSPAQQPPSNPDPAKPAEQAQQSPDATPVECKFALVDGKPVSYECFDPAGLKITPGKMAHPAALRKIFAEEQGPYDWAPACEAPPWLYAIDTMLPVLDLKVESGCGFLDGAWGWHVFRLIVTVLGAITIPLAALTFAGLLQRS